MDPVRLGWIAGLIEGEGWIGTRGAGRTNITVSSTDRDVCERLGEWSGVGHVGRRQRDTVVGKPVWMWRVTARQDADDLLRMILPLLCERRASRAREVLARAEANPSRKGKYAVSCMAGHPWTQGTIFINSDGRRRCRVCANARAERYRERKRAAA